MSHANALINMIKQQLRTGDVVNEVILDRFRAIPRDAFVPEKYKTFAYSDYPIPLDHGQFMWLPLEEALLLQALNLKGHEIVLEVGTGSGFLTALLSGLCQKVISIDYYKEFTERARSNLMAHGCDNVELLTGDAASGWPDRAPFDVIIFSNAQAQLTELQRLQVAPQGQIFAIIGTGSIMQGQLNETLLFETRVPSLIMPSRSVSQDFLC